MLAYAPSSDVVRELDELQAEFGEGPCLDSIWHEQRMLIEDMTQAHERWPRYAAAARERGIGSLLSFQLRQQRQRRRAEPVRGRAARVRRGIGGDGRGCSPRRPRWYCTAPSASTG